MRKPKVAAVKAAPKREPKPKPAHIPADGWTIKADDDGALNHVDLEDLAQMMADDVPAHEAWKALGKANDGSAGTKRRFAEKHPAFITRLNSLREERVELEKSDPIFGEAAWMARQVWRMARGKNDIKTMMEAAKLSYDIAKQRAGSRPAAPEGEEAPDEPKNGVGRPMKENPAARRDPAAIREAMKSMGRTREKDPENVEETDEND